MILTCPECGTQYVVKDGAIPPGGRNVRCASCKHSWHQDPEDGDAAAEPEAEPMASETPASAEPEVEHDEAETVAKAAVIDPRSGPELEERAFEAAALASAEEGAPVATETGSADVATSGGTDADHASSDAAAMASADDYDFSPFAAEEDDGARGRPAWLTALIGLLVIAAIAAAFWFLAPAAWKQRIGIAANDDTPLQLMMTHSDRQKLASGNELLAVSGRVINPTEQSQKVPPIQAQLRSRRGDLVYSWTIAPPARVLPPGASATFNSAEVNVPAGGDELTITLGDARA